MGGEEQEARKLAPFIHIFPERNQGPQPPQDPSIWSCLQLLCLCISVCPAALPLVCMWVVGRGDACLSLRVVLNLSCTVESSGEL